MNNVRMSTSYVVKVSFQHEIGKSRALSVTPVIVASHHVRVGKYIYALAPAVLRKDSGAGSFHSPDGSQSRSRLNDSRPSIQVIL